MFVTTIKHWLWKAKFQQHKLGPLAKGIASTLALVVSRFVVNQCHGY
jgi:hypothetical protein